MSIDSCQIAYCSILEAAQYLWKAFISIKLWWQAFFRQSGIRRRVDRFLWELTWIVLLISVFILLSSWANRKVWLGGCFASCVIRFIPYTLPSYRADFSSPSTSSFQPHPTAPLSVWWHFAIVAFASYTAVQSIA